MKVFVYLLNSIYAQANEYELANFTSSWLCVAAFEVARMMQHIEHFLLIQIDIRNLFMALVDLTPKMVSLCKVDNVL